MGIGSPVNPYGPYYNPATHAAEKYNQQTKDDEPFLVTVALAPIRYLEDKLFRAAEYTFLPGSLILGGLAVYYLRK
jgi:hypothetical protein